MRRAKRILGSGVLAASLLFGISSLGCAGRVRVYDEYHSDWHTWDHGEDVYYHRYWDEHHQPYRDYNKLSKDEQRDYWNWRHEQH